jgi:hypothetical protein
METEPITIHVDAEAARAFKAASEEEQRKLEALLSLRLLEATDRSRPLKEIMSEISRQARERGLTPEILKDILDEDR